MAQSRADKNMSGHCLMQNHLSHSLSLVAYVIVKHCIAFYCIIDFTINIGKYLQHLAHIVCLQASSHQCVSISVQMLCMRSIDSSASVKHFM